MSASESASATGVVLAGKYRLDSVLGRGGMGTVWRAQHLGLGAPVAIKIIDPTIPSSDEAMRQCRNEARAAAALRSPHVVQVLDFGLDQATGSSFIVMELLEGESLADRLARAGRMSPADTSRVVTHVARALGRAHEAGIVHRDLKPANVFLVHNDDEETAKVLDFGTARMQRTGTLAESGPSTGAIVGTPYYMSPEHITGARVDHRTDLWALGVMACECLVGRRPFNAREIGELVLQICTYPIPAPSQLARAERGRLPPGIDAWFARATDRDPSRRFQSARELADELRRACGGEAPVNTRAPDAGTPGAPRQELTARTMELPPNTAELGPDTGVALASGPAAPLPRAGRRTGLRAALSLAVLVVLAVSGVMVWRMGYVDRSKIGSATGGEPPPTGGGPPAPREPATRAAAPAPATAATPTATPAPAVDSEGAVAKRQAPRRRAKDLRTTRASKAHAASARAPRGSPPSPVESVLDQRR